MSDIRDGRFLYITSGDQLHQNVNTFSFTIQLDQTKNYDRITLMQANIPISYYTIQAGFNTFTLTENNISVLVTLPIGNYNANSFATIVGNVMSSTSPNNLTYTITYPNSFNQTQTGKFTYTVNSTITPISLTFPVNSVINNQFGFDAGSTNTFTVGSLTSTLISTDVINFIPENTIFIHSNLVIDENGTDVLQEIFSNNTQPFQNLVFLNPNPSQYSKKLATGKIQSATFSITDEYGSHIYLNGLDVVLTLLVYKQDDTNEKIQKYMKYLIDLDILL